MKKSELKAGQKVVQRNGCDFIYFPNNKGFELISFLGGLNYISAYGYDLKDTLRHNREYDITSVYECNNNSITNIFTNYSEVEWSLVWREEPQIEEITAEEAIKRLEEQSEKRIKIVSIR